ncbi:hypothetical protein BJY04DRAFT_220312 [Aspergillus karnatakaensis]|uniref:uncharacterized protein n=1 Tax=Aspergillus karnatakaensis TaxID=1810916 RepID=UPI003CCE4EF8
MPRRVAIACKFCRSRKRKCDGRLPRCSTCESLQLECVYQEQTQPTASERLEKIESLLKVHGDAIAELSRSASRDGSTQSPTHPAPCDEAEPRLTPKDPFTPPLFNIPIGHRSTTSSILVLPQVRPLAGEFPHDTFYRLEACRPPLGDVPFSLESLDHHNLVVDPARADELLRHFFELVYPYHPLFEREELMLLFDRVADRGLQQDEESAVYLVVIALGSISSEPRRQSEVPEHAMPGFAHFNAAFRILIAAWTNSFGSNVVLAQGLVLSALYLLYLMRPLQAWRLIHMASTSIQQTLIGSEQLSEAERETVTRVCWSCFLIECDNLAEFDHPRSGIEPLVDNLPFPSCNPPNLDLQRYLANLSMRCLLNRIHHCLYFSSETPTHTPWTPATVQAAPSPPRPPSRAISRVCSELELQIQNWYGMLPDAIRPDLDPQDSGDLHKRLLQLRYWSSKQILYRPYVIYATSRPAEQLSDDIVSACETCVSACRGYLYASVPFLSRPSPSPYTYMAIQCALGSILVLTLARSCPTLEHLVPDIDALQTIAVDMLQLWSSPGSSVMCTLEIAISIRTKQRLRGSRSGR